jgi:molybdate transport system ATP-binding protein
MTEAEGLHIRLSLARQGFALKVDLALPSSGISVLYGPSGSGKTSVLRCVAGLERATPARVRVGREIWQDDAKAVFRPPWTRDLGYVFQEASLFAHLNVQENLVFGLQRSRKPGAADALERSIGLLGIGHLLQRNPSHLSGGERQRVAIARALATQPRLLLLDEPLASLDQARRFEILPWLEKMRDELRIPMLYVTHSPEELTRLADVVVVLQAGQVAAYGPTQQVLSQTVAPVIVGDEDGVVVSATVVEHDFRWHLAKVDFVGGSLWVRDGAMNLGQTVRLRILARDVSLTTLANPRSSIQNQLSGHIESIVDDAHPSQALVRVRCAESILVARVTQRSLSVLQLSPGSQVWAQVKSVAVMS